MQRQPVRSILSVAVSKQLQAIEKRHNDINTLLLAPDLETKEFIRLSRELASLAKSVQAIHADRESEQEAAGLRAVIAEAAADKTAESAELAALAQAELAELEGGLTEAENGLKRLLVPRDEADARDCILEFRAGTGGDEAGLFAGACAQRPLEGVALCTPNPPFPSLPSADLMAMYQHYAASKGWGWSPLAVAKTEYDGVREASVGVSGTGAQSETDTS